MRDDSQLEKAVSGRINEWNGHMKEARLTGDTHYVQRCDTVLTILKGILHEGRAGEI